MYRENRFSKVPIHGCYFDVYSTNFIVYEKRLLGNSMFSGRFKQTGLRYQTAACNEENILTCAYSECFITKFRRTS